MSIALERSAPSSADSRITAAMLTLTLVWGGTVAILAARGALQPLPPFAIAALVVSGILLPTLAYRTLPALQHYFAQVGLYWLTIVHVWRIPAAFAFFYFGALDELPPLFWILAGTGDLLAGLYAARLLFVPGDLAYFRSFHRFGFADFVVAVGTGFAHTLLQDPRMASITVLPMALIPFFGVGLSGASHLIAFHLLGTREAQASPQTLVGQDK